MCDKDIALKKNGSFRLHTNSWGDEECVGSNLTPDKAHDYWFGIKKTSKEGEQLEVPRQEEEKILKSSLLAFLQENLQIRVKVDEVGMYPDLRKKIEVELRMDKHVIDYDYAYLDGF